MENRKGNRRKDFEQNPETSKTRYSLPRDARDVARNTWRFIIEIDEKRSRVSRIDSSLLPPSKERSIEERGKEKKKME